MIFLLKFQDGEERRKFGSPSIVTVNQMLLESCSMSTAFDSLFLGKGRKGIPEEKKGH